MEHRAGSSRLIVVAFASVLSAVLVLGVWWRATNPRDSSAPVDVGDPRESEADRTATELTPMTLSAKSIQSSVSSPEADSTEAQSSPASDPQPNVASKQWMIVHVQDDAGAPIGNASVQINATDITREEERAKTPGKRNVIALSDEEGNSRLSYAKSQSNDGAPRLVELSVTHPDFLPSTVRGVTLGTGRLIVTLHPARRVVVTAITSNGRSLADFAVHADRNGWTTAEWVARLDGRKETTQLSAGMHTLWADHDSAAFGHLSGVASFEVTDTGWQEVVVTLPPSPVVQGRLAECVPRPVRNGRVRLIAHVGGKIDRGFVKQMDAAIMEDGTFEFGGVPAGFCEVFALCSGWVTTVNSESERDDLRRACSLAEPSNWVGGPPHWTLRQITVPASQPVVLPMERTGSIAFSIQDKRGVGIAYAVVSVSTQFNSLPGYSSSVPWRNWYARTDTSGTAVIEDVPPHERTAVDADAEWPKAIAPVSAQIAVKSGETTEVTIVLETK